MMSVVESPLSSRATETATATERLVIVGGGMASIGLSIPMISMISLSGCGKSDVSIQASAAPAAGVSYQAFSDAVHEVMMADRTVYATHVVTRLKSQKASVTPSEYWEDEEHTIPLPAQMFAMGATLVSEGGKAGFSYMLKSKWPLNEQHHPVGDVEKKALDSLAENPDKPFYGEEEIDGNKFFIAAYADKAVAEACWTCHNDHANRKDDYPEFKKDDVMGGVIVRVPMK